jgi:hypothetical protein
MLPRLTQLNHDREMAFVEKTGELAGIAQLSANDDHGTAEYAFLVLTDLQNGCTLLACLPVMPPLQ